MPYIKQERRKELSDFSSMINERLILKNPGDLNYIITLIIKEYFDTNGGNYQAANDIMGALEGAKLEFYRRRVEAYENSKITENGDVF